MDDQCCYLGEYTAREGYAFSATNHLIINFRKSMTVMADPNVSTIVKRLWKLQHPFGTLGILPFSTPSLSFPFPRRRQSKAKGHPLYDDRLIQMLLEIRPQPTLDVREIIMQDTSTDPAHDTEDRPSPDDIAAMYKIDETLTTPEPSLVAVVDDVLTTLEPTIELLIRN